MDNTEYNTRFNEVKIADLAVKHSIKRFNSKTVSKLDLKSYQSSLKNIKKKLEVFEGNADRILVVVKDDDPRKDYLETRRDELSEEVKKNENKVNSRMEEIEKSLPNDKEEEAKVRRNKKLKLRMETLNSMITKLMTDLAAVKKAKLLDDNEVRHTLGNLP